MKGVALTSTQMRALKKLAACADRNDASEGYVSPYAQSIHGTTVNALMKRGLIKRKPGKYYEYYIRITAAGRDALADTGSLPTQTLTPAQTTALKKLAELRQRYKPEYWWTVGVSIGIKQRTEDVLVERGLIDRKNGTYLQIITINEKGLDAIKEKAAT